MVVEVPDDGRQGIQSVEIAATVLEALERGLGPMRLTQSATVCARGPSKVHRYLVSLGRAGRVMRSPSSGLYDMGPTLRRMGMESLRRMDEVGVASEALPGLRDRTGHAVNLAVWGDHGPVIVRWNYGSHALPITVRIGATMPMLASSVGRVYLAHLPETLTGPVLRAQAEADSGVQPSAAELARICDTVRRDGFALTRGGVVPGVTSVAAPVFSDADSLPLVVSVAMPARQVDDTVLADVSAALLHTVGTLSAKLGHTGAGADAAVHR